MGPLNGRNLERVKYFSIKEYLSKIRIESRTFDQMEYVNKEFDEYLNKLMTYKELAVIYFLCSCFEKEIRYSNLIENHFITPLEINEHNMLFDTMAINHNRIKELHKFVTKDTEKRDYRNTEMKVGTFREVTEDVNLENLNTFIKDGKEYYEDIYWYGVEKEDVKRFMDDFINFYKDTSSSVIHSNPFIKSSLVQLIFLRIHPFEDGNGRTARMLHNLKFTDLINRIKGSNLRISPLNISPGIANYKNNYNKCIDNIYFDLDHLDGINSNNIEINNYLRFLLTTVEDELIFLQNQLNQNEQALENISNMDNGEELFKDSIKKMKLKALTSKKY